MEVSARTAASLNRWRLWGPPLLVSSERALQVADHGYSPLTETRGRKAYTRTRSSVAGDRRYQAS